MTEQVKETDDQMMARLDKEHAEREALIPHWCVAGLKGKFEPEVVWMGANWVVGPSQDTREEARKLAEEAVAACMNSIKNAANQHIGQRGWKKAKA